MRTRQACIYDDGSWWDYGAGIGGDVLDFVGYCIHGTTYTPSVHFTEVVDMLGGLDIKRCQPSQHDLHHQNLS